MFHGGAVTGGDDGVDERAFLRVVCHELGTPVASVQALAHALAHQATALSAEQKLEALRLIEDHAAHLAATLDAVRVVADHLPRSGAPVMSIRLLDLVRGAAHAAGIDRLRVHIAPTIHVITIDGPTVRRIITNLLENARQHGAEPIDLRVEHRPPGLRILITDHGDGIPAKVLDAAFDRAAPAADGQHGFGLWIVTRLVTMLGGCVRVHAGVPAGTRIEVALPLGG